ncbi:MAG: hypothetical protein ABJE66_14925 [Deltaproteobacteria bacterium]
MKWIVHEIGSSGWRGTVGEAPGVVIDVDRGVTRLLSRAGMHAFVGTAPRSRGRETELGPFTRDRVAKKERLAWEHGSVTYSMYADVAVWSDRFAAIADDQGLTIIDATSERIARLTLGRETKLHWRTFELAASDERLWIAGGDGRIWELQLAELEGLAAAKQGPTPVEVHYAYPLRDREARLACGFLWRVQNGRTMVEIGNGRGGVHEPKLLIDLPPWELEKYSPLVLFDRLAPDVWQRAELPGKPPVALLDPDRVTTLAAKLRHSKAEHPEGAARPVVARADPGARAKVERLIAAIATEPEDDGHREVLVDLLQELDDPGAATFAALRVGTDVSAAKRKLALGPLAPFLIDVVYRSGLPARAVLSRSAPRDEASIAAAVADYRLGLLTELRIGLGTESVYTALVAARRATALRDVDLPHIKTIAALVAVERTQLVRLGHLDLAKPRTISPLAVATFDRATTFHATVNDNADLERWTERVTANPKGVYSRVGRALELDEVDGHHDALRRLLRPFLERLPFTSIKIGGR